MEYFCGVWPCAGRCALGDWMTTSSAKGTKSLTGSVFFILLALADGDRHGLGIADDVAARTEGEIEMGPGTLYNALRKMLARGLIKEAKRRPAPEQDDPRRRYYRITKKGLEAISAEAARLDRVLAAVREKDLLPATKRS